MAAPRRRDLIRRRRRVEDEGEDDVSVATEHLDESQSEASLPSDAEEDADADYSDLSETEATESAAAPTVPSKANGFSKSGHLQPHESQPNKAGSQATKIETSSFTTLTDTEVMLNGLKITETAASDEGVEFETMGGSDLSPIAGVAPVRPVSSNGRRETPAERRRRENEEYRKRKEADPAFIPNRGPFFMHDQRSSPAGHNGTRPAGRGRGRGRVPVGGPFSPATLQAQAEEAANGTWAHDLHETLLEAELKPIPQSDQQTISTPTNYVGTTSGAPMLKPVAPASKPAPVRTFSTTREIAKALVRVYLPGMKAPITFADVPIRLYARLPNHRPPLRRDKPVRISLPDQPPRYIFPSTERSFIFIPRALRPNQQGFGRGRGRVFGSFGGYSSRRTSTYGGSVYSPSIAMSRRSSLARDYSRDGLISPVGSVISRPSGPADTNKPVVRLPPGTQQQPGVGTPTQPVLSSGGGTPVVNLPQPHSYPLPQRPAPREHYPGAGLPMHQPRPQKAVSVAGIESPEALPFQPPQPQEQQPFHQQVPVHLSNQPSNEPSTFFPHTRQLSYPNQPTTGTPLSNIPERAIHAQPFQPFHPGFQHGYPPQPGFFYPPPNGVQPQYPMGAPPPGTVVPVFVQPNGQQVPYVMPGVATSVPVGPSSASQQQASMVAHETNGMVYYYDPNQLYAAPPVEGYAAPGYTVPGIGGMMTPSPDGYYYPTPAGAVYYQHQ